MKSLRIALLFISALVPATSAFADVRAPISSRAVAPVAPGPRSATRPHLGPKALEPTAHGTIHRPEPAVYLIANRGPSSNGTAGGLGKVMNGAAASLRPQGKVVWAYSLKPGEAAPGAHADGYERMGIALTPEEETGFYSQFSNGVLWPAFHGNAAMIRRSDGAFDTYEAINQRYAARLAHDAPAGSVFWFQDYHLALAPRALRAELGRLGKADGSRIGWFSHIPWPSREVTRTVFTDHEREAIFGGLFGSDLITFQTTEFADNFVASAEDFLASERGRELYPNARVRHGKARAGDARGLHAIEIDGRTIRIGATPIGIDTSAARAMAMSGETRQAKETMRETLGIGNDVRVVASVDRLDYTKGFPERLATIETFFRRYPAYIGKVTFVQIAPATREGQSTFEEHDAHVSRLAADLDERFRRDPVIAEHKRRNGVDPTWVPSVLHRTVFTPNQVAALYQTADVAWVTSLADGMHLGPAEALTARGSSDPAVLVMSNRVGASATYGKHSVVFDPHDTAQAADALLRSLTMGKAEKEANWVMAYNVAMRHDGGGWVKRNLREMSRP